MASTLVQPGSTCRRTISAAALVSVLALLPATQLYVVARAAAAPSNIQAVRRARAVITPNQTSAPDGGTITTGSTTSNGGNGVSPTNPTIGGADSGEGNTGTASSTTGNGETGGYGGGGVPAATGTSGSGGDGVCII